MPCAFLLRSNLQSSSLASGIRVINTFRMFSRMKSMEGRVKTSIMRSRTCQNSKLHPEERRTVPVSSSRLRSCDQPYKAACTRVSYNRCDLPNSITRSHRLDAKSKALSPMSPSFGSDTNPHQCDQQLDVQDSNFSLISQICAMISYSPSDQQA